MARGFIVVDKIPGNCRHIRGDAENGCPYGGMVCQITGEDVMHYLNDGTKPDWCPVKQMPERKDYKGPDAVNGILMSTRAEQAIDEAGKMGWNACIDEILKGEA